jgi:tripartite-type tricarboxylate transporter receptor subunit TctC
MALRVAGRRRGQRHVPEIVDLLHNEINAALADPAMRARLTDLGLMPMRTSLADFGKFIADETEKWGKVVRFAGLKPQ